MARGVMAISLSLVVVVVLMAQQASAQSGCMTAIVSLSPCLNFITGNTSTPSSSCCSSLASVVQSQPQCLCAVLGGATSSLGVTINNTRALELPAACKVQTPPVSKCNALGGAPAASPTATPTPATPSTPSTPETPSTSSTPSVPSVPSGSSSSKTTPSTTTQSSDGNSNKLAMIPIVFFGSLASLAIF
ncbi:non-specific lipid transfer protein GPI-anchored 15-like isoform X1 [Typha latifolia]|uniref:non-specific lipid transfer protein GPI-anchored 15-like isoform X1 n=1 Tax=Typha latifolia TaxID=4733 RepID=UPI003C2E57AD